MLYILQCWWMTQRRKWADADNTNEKKAHGLSLDGLKYRIVKKVCRANVMVTDKKNKMTEKDIGGSKALNFKQMICTIRLMYR